MGGTLSEAVARITKDEPGVEIRTAVVDGNAAKALITPARGADLLVVGNHGQGAFTEALLGSVGGHAEVRRGTQEYAGRSGDFRVPALKVVRPCHHDTGCVAPEAGSATR